MDNLTLYWVSEGELEILTQHVLRAHSVPDDFIYLLI